MNTEGQPRRDLEKTGRRELIELFKIWSLYSAPTGGEGKRQTFLEDLAKKFGWESRRDEAGNISIHIPAAEGFKDAPTTVLHGHIDMVTEGGNDQNPTRSMIDEERWMRAVGETTLGSDNGAGVVSILQLLLDIKQGRIAAHGEIVALFTIGEESQNPVRQPDGSYVSKGGLFGARQLDAAAHFSDLQGKDVIFINTDSEDGLGVITNGSAAGASMLVEVNSTEQHESISGDVIMEVAIEGFRGGHSGTQIGEGRGSAIVALGSTIQALQEAGIDARIVEVSGGTKPNAIPRSARCVLAIPSAQREKAEQILRQLQDGNSVEWQNILRATGHIQSDKPEDHPHLLANVGTTQQSAKLNAQATADLVRLLTETPAGPVTSDTSNNLGVLEMDPDGRVLLSIMPRGQRKDKLEELADQIGALVGKTQSKLVYDARYGHWQEPEAATAVLSAQAVMSEVIQEVTGQDEPPKIEETLGGLEVALLREALEKMGVRSVSAISAGPEIVDPHSPKERVNVPSWEGFDQALRLSVLRIAQPQENIRTLASAARVSTRRRSGKTQSAA